MLSPLLAVDPLAEIVTEATLCHDSDPPETVGAVGAVRFKRTVLPEVGVAGPQPEVWPNPSTAWNCTSVSPSAVMVIPSAAVVEVPADHVLPPSVEVRTLYEAMPDPGSDAPIGVTLTDARSCHAVDPPAASGVVGAVRSILTVACVQPEVFPAMSTAWNWTSVSPSAVIVAVESLVSVDQVVPPSLDVSY
jgi:hypothetical protein